MKAGAFVVAAFLASFVPAAADEVVPPAVRNVTPPGMTPGPAVDGPLIREPVAPRPPDPPRWRRFFLPATTDAATFVVNKLTIHIAGVTPLPPNVFCKLPGGSTWPCGQTALFSLRRFLHGRAVECFLSEPGAATEVTATCRVGSTDIATWLLSYGWVKAGDSPSDGDLAALTAARCASLGIWRGVAPPPAEDCRRPHIN